MRNILDNQDSMTQDKEINKNIWKLQPILFVGLLVLCYIAGIRLDLSMLVIALSLSMGFTAWIWNELRAKSILKAEPEHQQARYPAVPDKLMRKLPQDGDIVIGISRNDDYVCLNIAEDAHLLIVGNSGSGKSSCIVIPTLLCNPKTRIFALDIKGELAAKSTRLGDERICIFNPQDRNTYGYDPFFRLSDGSSEQEIFETMQTIAHSLIHKSAGIKDPFWVNSARNLLIGFFIYYYKQGETDLISITDAILSRPVKQSVQMVMESAQPGTNEFKYCVQFSDMAEETLSGVFAEVANALVVFSTDEEIRYAFRDNRRKISPRMLEDGYSIYLGIREEKLSAYYTVLQLILNQTLGELERRPEDAEPILFLIDELPRILSAGKLEKLLDSSRTLRSRRVRLMLVTQSIEALMTAYSENEAIDLMSNCAYKIILDASSPRTQKMVCEWAGKYKERRMSVSDAGVGERRKNTISYEDKAILLPSDIMTLAKTGELVLISPYGYHRIKKCPYYKDSYFKIIADRVKRHNETIKPIIPTNKDSEFRNELQLKKQ